MHSLVTSIFLYACKSWTLTAELQRRIQAMEIRCYRKILHISYKDLLTIVETQTEVAWKCLPFIRSDQKHLARHSERGTKTRQTGEEVGRQQQGNGQAWSSASPRGQWRTGKMEKTGCKIICGAPTTLAVKGLMMMMMMTEI